MRLLVVCNHGGSCCGIRHLRGFVGYLSTEGTREEFILKSVDQIVKARLPDGGNRSAGIPNCDCTECVQSREEAADPAKYIKRQREWITAVECVLAGEQYKTWKEPLEKCGFKEVFSFKNSNSKNMCHVFYGTTNPVTEVKDVESAPQDTEIAV